MVSTTLNIQRKQIKAKRQIITGVFRKQIFGDLFGIPDVHPFSRLLKNA